MRNLIHLVLVIGLLAIFLSGCGLSERPYPLVRTYTLELSQGADGTTLRKNPRAVIMVTSSPPPAAYDGKKLVYKLKAHELAPDFYNEFYSPPGRAIADSLATYLDLNSPSIQIVRFQGASAPDYSLEVGIADFYGDYSVSPAVLRLSLTITLNDLRRVTPKVLFTNRYNKTPVLTPRQGEDRAENLVRQMTETLAELFPQILSDLEGSLNLRR
ncbi:MAG: PqiC family protein [Deltaproteobacteria bacterium]|jgi:ABC-type uncharacterized transport system auxiliary subunit|nr:PqiC family protein [Deltaproteobacteria bacterium]